MYLKCKLQKKETLVGINLLLNSFDIGIADDEESENTGVKLWMMTWVGFYDSDYFCSKPEVFYYQYQTDIVTIETKYRKPPVS